MRLEWTWLALWAGEWLKLKTDLSLNDENMTSQSHVSHMHTGSESILNKTHTHTADTQTPTKSTCTYCILYPAVKVSDVISHQLLNHIFSYSQSVQKHNMIHCCVWMLCPYTVLYPCLNPKCLCCLCVCSIEMWIVWWVLATLES